MTRVIMTEYNQTLTSFCCGSLAPGSVAEAPVAFWMPTEGAGKNDGLCGRKSEGAAKPPGDVNRGACMNVGDGNEKDGDA